LQKPDGRHSLSVAGKGAVYRPGSVAELADLVRAAGARGERLRAVGSGHSWSDAAVPAESKVQLRALTGVVSADASRGLFTVRGGTTLAELVAVMRESGWALHNLPSVTEQTVAGAIATGTHGTGIALGNIAEAVVEVELVDGTGAVRRVTEATEGDLLNAVRCNLGALGIVTEVTFRGVRAYNVREVQVPMPLRDAARDLDALLRAHDNVKLWVEPHSGMANVFLQNRTADPVTDTWATVPLIEARTLVLEAVQHLTMWVPASIPPVFRYIFGTLGAWSGSERVGTPETVYRIPHRIASHAETEIIIPYAAETTPRALLDLVAAIAEDHALGHILEIRFARGDAQWISMGAGSGPSCYITVCVMHGRGEEAVEALFRMAESKLDGRPHWAKSFYRRGGAVTGKYPRWGDWNELRKRWDPKGIFVNDFVDRLLEE
jgi:FAD/FMN-containing dehydrogenase